jgi:hypothetical protein
MVFSLISVIPQLRLAIPAIPHILVPNLTDFFDYRWSGRVSAAARRSSFSQAPA